MRRRGFIEKFAKTAAGIVLAPEEWLNLGTRKQNKSFLPIVVKVTDETVLKDGKLNEDVLVKMFISGFNAVYPDIGEDDFWATLFPGLLQGAFVGLKLYSEQHSPFYLMESAVAAIDAVKSFSKDASFSAEENFILWMGQETFKGSINKQKLRYKLFEPKDFVFTESEESLEFMGMRLFSHPLLNRICQFQLGLAEYQGGNKTNLCRDLYLNCFFNREDELWLSKLKDEQKWNLFDDLQYPLGMKFRLYMLESLQYNNSIYISGDGILIDRVIVWEQDTLNRSSNEKDKNDLSGILKINLIHIHNPSARLAGKIALSREGDAYYLIWEDEGEEFRIFRCTEDRCYPSREFLIGITKNKRFKIEETNGIDKYKYLVTCDWKC